MVLPAAAGVEVPSANTSTSVTAINVVNKRMARASPKPRLF